MRYLMSSLETSYPSADDYRVMSQKIEDLQKQLLEQSKEIFDLKWELSSLKYAVIQEKNPGIEHPLMNDVILRRLAYFLSKGDLLNCRLVCKKWNDAVLPRIRRQFYFHFKQHYGWLLIYVLIYAILLMPRMFIGATSNASSSR